MAEHFSPQDRGHNPNTQLVVLELHRLLAIYLSSRSFAELRTGIGEKWEPIDELQSCEEDEITRILLAVAITFRIIDNREKVFKPTSRVCGTLVKDLDHPATTEPLSVRDACNKIIHAHVILGDVGHTKGGQVYLNPIIYLYGLPGTVQWKATLNIIEFAKEYVSIVSYY